MFCGVSLAVLASVAATSVMDVPDPRPTHHVVDLSGTLTSADITAIDAAAREADAYGELFVVVVPSTDGANPRQWTTALFNRMRLDTQSNNRGVVLMAAIQDRKAEIVLGDGYPAATTAITDAIMQGVVVAHFKRGDARGALVQGAQRIVSDVLRVSPQHTQHTQQAQPVAPVPPPVHSEDASELDGPTALAFGGVGLFGAVLAGRRWYRRRPRTCANCKARLRLLGEEVDDAHLRPGERTEEKLGSVDYDIWACPRCSYVLKTRWGALFTSYAKCSACQWKTMSSTSRTITFATTTSTGLSEITEVCRHCSHQRSYTVVIPVVVESSSSDSSSSYSSSDSGGSSSGSGSSGSW